MKRYDIVQAEGGWQIVQLRHVLIGTFPEAGTAALVRDLLEASDEEEEEGEKPSAVADDYRKPAHVLSAAWSRRLAAKREAAGKPLRAAGATAREDAEAGL